HPNVTILLLPDFGGVTKDRLYKLDQSVQTVYMLCKPKPFYDEKKKVTIGYKNPLCLTCAKQVQSALYNGTEIVMTNHKPAVVHDSEETLEIAALTRKRMYEKMKSPQRTLGTSLTGVLGGYTVGVESGLRTEASTFFLSFSSLA
ncbi:hypothetical protein Tco_1087664, partial [Tanacetum coccineum]